MGQFPLLDPRPFYLQWAAGNPLANPYLAGMRGPGPPPLHLHSLGLAQWNNLKALAQQNLAKSLLQASGSSSATQPAPHSAPQTNCKTFLRPHPSLPPPIPGLAFQKLD